MFDVADIQCDRHQCDKCRHHGCFCGSFHRDVEGDKNAGQEENVSEADSDSNAADLSDTESNVSGQYKQSSDSDGTGDTEKVKNTESTEAAEAIEETEKTEETEQPELKTVFDYSNDAVRVVVTLSNETDLPAGAELVVAPVAVTAEMEASIDKAMEGESKEKKRLWRMTSPL